MYRIGPEFPCFIIAEVGVNHNGNIDLAFKLIDEAHRSGVDAVKFQTFTAENLVTRTAKMATYQKNNLGTEKSQFEMLKELELKMSDFSELKAYTEKKGLTFISTPFDIEAFDLLEAINLEVYKVGSGDLTNLPLIELIAKTGKPMIISTGMADMDEVMESAELIKSCGNTPVILHCTSNYPTADHEVNLQAMNSIAEYTGCIVGYSDHTTSLEIPAIAVAKGAKVIEKHLTLDKQMVGPDHKASIEPDELARMVKKIRWMETLIGSGVKQPSKSELETAIVARKSLIALTTIKKGEVIKEEQIGVKRPGTGLKPKYFKNFVGKIASRDLEPETLLTWEDIR